MEPFNPIHHVSPGDELPELVQAVIEVPRGSRLKYEVDKQTGMLRLDRVLYSSIYYPANYGFIPQTYAEDDDALDILVISSFAVQPLTLMRARVLGVLRMEDAQARDDKIIAVAADDVSVSHIESLDSLPEHWYREVRNFFEEYKQLEEVDTAVQEFLDQEKAYTIIREALQRYK